ncbi:biotin--[acetyl-CoA-carboxylase] ligase [Methanosphaera sp. ISO3-F5]|uniref:biotin--[acetyl-CoA-carboxylase] ligase n=1 Tax=Methanosphaera sp. ISO3-F5 TaxID=1452353 RepID=UPI002B2646D7|nr:biotin--[acetyl-CoA-carboxylase] ligase [Methanosphaera sp. ISO3-F5]WQH64114.1 biotin--[acetyl-CoA-carboxylase] ligase [Methanosphaera sp. ISO3-F5]
MIRQHILKNIEEEYATESELLKKLEISQEKLLKNIEILKEAGYKIVHNDQGYKLEDTPDIIEPFEVSRGLTSKYIGHNIHFYEELESTNDTAKQFVDNDATEGTVIIAAHQTAGRTRKHEGWVSPEGGIYMTIIVRPEVTLLEASKLTIVTGVAIAKTLKDEFNVNVGIKWPNDLLIGQKKICGILTEAVTDYDKVKAILLGVGIDVNIDEKDIPNELEHIATTVQKETNITLQRAEIMRKFFKIFEDLYEEYKKNNFKYIISEWRRLSSTTGNRVKVYKHGKAIKADAVGITNSGALIIETDDGKLEKITSGECDIINDD